MFNWLISHSYIYYEYISYNLLRIDNIKFEKSEIDEEKEFNKIYNFEIDKKLEQFSKIYINKVKINTKIHEL